MSIILIVSETHKEQINTQDDLEMSALRYLRLKELSHSAHKAPKVIVSLVELLKTWTKILQLWVAPGHCTQRQMLPLQTHAEGHRPRHSALSVL